MKARLNVPLGLAIDTEDNLFIADTYNSRVRVITPNGFIYTAAGSASPGFGGDGGPASGAQINVPYAIASAANGEIYFADRSNHIVRKLTRETSSERVLFLNAASRQTGNVAPEQQITLEGTGLANIVRAQLRDQASAGAGHANSGIKRLSSPSGGPSMPSGASRPRLLLVSKSSAI